MLNRRLAGLVGCLALLPVLAVASPAIADDASPSPSPLTAVADTYQDRSGVIHYAFDPSELPSAQMETVKGTKRPDGTCSAEVSGSLDANSRLTIVGEEVSYDPATCVSRFAVATYPAKDVPAVVQENHPELAARVMPADGASAAAATYYYAWLGASYQDPVKLTVNSVTSGQGWYSDGRITKHVNDTYWLTGSGWTRVSSSAANSNSGRYTNTKAKYSNTKFCVTEPNTITNFTTAKLTTKTNGGTTHSVSASKSGGCSDWLSLKYGVTAL